MELYLMLTLSDKHVGEGAGNTPTPIKSSKDRCPNPKRRLHLQLQIQRLRGPLAIDLSCFCTIVMEIQLCTINTHFLFKKLIPAQ